MQMILLGFYSDGSNIHNAEQLLTREVYIGEPLGDETDGDEMAKLDRAYEELSAAKQAVDTTGHYGRTLIVLEPDEH